MKESSSLKSSSTFAASNNNRTIFEKTKTFRHCRARSFFLQARLCYHAWVKNSASAHKLVVFGEFFLDFVFYDLANMPRFGEEVKTTRFAIFPGGGLATTSLVAAGLGTPTSAITRVGREVLESPAWKEIQRKGVSLVGCEIDAQLPTAMTVCLAFGGDRMMITHDIINRGLERLFRRPQIQKSIKQARHLHLACALWPPRMWKPVLARLRQQHLPLSADIGWNTEVLKSPQLPSLLKGMEFTFPNELEAKAMTGEKTLEAAARKLAGWVRVPVVKLGKDGSLAVNDGQILRVRPLKVTTVDATGSGDAFNGGFLHGYLKGWSLEDCMRAGNVCGALAATRAGGSSAVPSRTKLKMLMNKLR